MDPVKTDVTAEARKLPRADRLLAAAEAAGLLAQLGHAPVMEVIRGELDAARESVLGGAACPPPQEIERRVVARLAGEARGSLRRVVNATGVVVHTNLGRAPLSGAALSAMARVAGGYSNLEYDLGAGARGDRYGHAAAALCRLTGAEAAVVVNNNASSVLVALAALTEATPQGRTGSSPDRAPGPREGPGALPEPAGGAASGQAAPAPEQARTPELAALERLASLLPRAPPPPEVVISRGQLVEIGGGFRIPDVLRRSGAALVEVGTTNRTRIHDYREAITPRTAMLLSVHRSNFKLSGFVEDAPLEALVALGREKGLWVVDDVGSGTLLETASFGLGVEPTVQERVRAGADLVCFSGDKLLGGPQAGILVGRREAVERVKRHPLMRALRVDKVTLAGLSATLGHYERGEALTEVPVWRAIAQRPEALGARARGWLEALGALGRGAEVRDGVSAVGGGSLPDVTLPTRVLALPGGGDADALLARLRGAEVPVIGRIEEDRVVLDPRTVLPGEDDDLLAGVRGALGGSDRVPVRRPLP